MGPALALDDRGGASQPCMPRRLTQQDWEEAPCLNYRTLSQIAHGGLVQPAREAHLWCQRSGQGTVMGGRVGTREPGIGRRLSAVQGDGHAVAGQRWND